jgi:rubrerythrin
MAENLQEVIQMARKMEIDGIEFYSNAAEEAANKQAELLFSSLAQDEERHLHVIEDIAEGTGVNVEDLPKPAERIETAFTQASKQITERDVATASEKEAIKIALDMETRSYKIYEEAADKTDDEEQKALFERLAEEENQHYEMLNNTNEYLNDNKKWFLTQESGLLTGDMSSLGQG